MHGCHIPTPRQESVNELVREVSSEQDYRAFAQLIGEYVSWLRSRYEQDNWFITEVLDKQSLSSVE